MMKVSEELITLIAKYEELIRKGNSAFIKTYSLDKSPLLAKREGLIPQFGTMTFEGNEMAFSFHGIGCRLLFDDSIVVEFDYIFKQFVYKGFEVKKLFWFLESFPGVSAALRNQEQFREAILELESLGVLVKNEDDPINTYDYIFVGNN